MQPHSVDCRAESCAIVDGDSSPLVCVERHIDGKGVNNRVACCITTEVKPESVGRQSCCAVNPERSLLVGRQVECASGKVCHLAGGEASGADELGAVATLLGSWSRGVGGGGDVGSCCPGAIAVQKLVHGCRERDQRRAFGPRRGTTAGAGLAHYTDDITSNSNCGSR
ncbi:hypothetical protein KBI23_09505 [bacterium]|nr:hypothetical protein [bacterium]